MAKDKKMTTEELLEASEILQRIMGIDLNKVELERYEALRPVDKLIEDLKQDKALQRGPKAKGLPRVRKKVHWRTKRRRNREYYHAKTKWKNLEKRAESLKTGEGWYAHVILKWDQRGIPHFTLEEWLEVIYPLLEGRVPYFTRYDTGKGYVLDNILVREDKTGDVVFDGKEWLLKKLGYIL